MDYTDSEQGQYDLHREQHKSEQSIVSSGITAWHPLEVAKQWPRGCAVLRRWMSREYDLYRYAVIVSWNPKPHLPFEDDAEFARID